MKRPRRNKEGHLSKLETSVSDALKKLKTKRQKITYEKEKITYQVPHTYTPDFAIKFPCGHIRYIEVKGWFRPQDRTKMKYVRACNPDLDIRMYFPQEKKIYKKGKMTNVDWCKKYGYKCTVGHIPKVWMNKNG